MTDIFSTPWDHRCAVTGRKFKPTKGQGWYQAAPHKRGEKLKMRVVSPAAVKAGWVPKDYDGLGPEYGRCGIWEGE